MNTTIWCHVVFDAIPDNSPSLSLQLGSAIYEQAVVDQLQLHSTVKSLHTG